MERKPSLKDKKETILKSYEELLRRFKEREKAAESGGKKAETEKATDEAIVEKASACTVEGIVKGLADLKLDLSKTLADLSDKLIAETKRLAEIQQAIAIESGNLEDRYDIEVAAETLSILIRTQEEKKKVFEEEMALAREQWNKEQEAHKLAVKERDAALVKERKREAEEYGYNLALSRKKDKDAYEEEKAALKKALEEERAAQERALGERESAVAAQEAEIAGLRAKVEAFPAELAKAVELAEKEAISRTENRAKQEADLLAKEVEGERSVSELRIRVLEDTVAEQAARIETLTKQLNDAKAQVEKIAIKAIEGASGVNALSAVNKIALEQAKTVSARNS